MHIRSTSGGPGKVMARLAVALVSLAVLVSLEGCLPQQISQSEATITVSVIADGATNQTQVPSGSSVEATLKAAGIILGNLDRVDPPSYTVLREGDIVRVTRVREDFEVKQEDIPFTHQVVRNETLPEGETRLIQPGENGLQEITYRHLYENNLETSTTVVKTVVLQQPQPEIMMVGVQSPFAPLPLPGKLAYIAGGNAWIMEGTTANRRALVTSGDLDGRILVLSAKADWLLFTRKSTKPVDQEINTLWVINTVDKNARPINLHVPNVVHFASFVPNSVTTVAFSTVEPRAQAPGWQANNNLYFMKFGTQGVLGKAAKIIESNAGGIYGWWGTNFVWSPDGIRLAYSRPDGIGLISLDDKSLVPLFDVTPLQTRSDWTLIPGLTWGADGRSLFFVTHAQPPNLVNPEESPFFDLSAYSLANGAEMDLAQQAGMFAYPSTSSLRINNSERSYYISFLQAILPAQSDVSRYKLVIMDRDGSNRRVLFPPEGSQGLEPQTPVWAPQPISTTEGDFVAVVYQGNLWLIDVAAGAAHQVTGDGLISKIDWK
jgi:hypothetical protein